MPLAVYIEENWDKWTKYSIFLTKENNTRAGIPGVVGERSGKKR